jgi:hypothetical protein
MRFMSLALLLIAGCGGPGMTLSGQVTFKGQPIENGRIIFTPLAPDIPAVGATIQSGRYSIPASQGAPPGAAYAVEITAVAKTGRRVANVAMPGSPPVEQVINPIPEVYNRKTTLRVTVSARAADNVFDFHLMKP